MGPEIIEIAGARDPLTGADLSLRLKSGRIDWVGPRTALPALQPAINGKGAAPVRVIDAAGLYVLPGFCESHLHLFQGGVTLQQLNLLGVEGEDALRAAVAAYRSTRQTEPLLGAWSANYEIFGAGTRPDRHGLDRICPDQPLLMLAVDLHTGWANTAALTAAGLMDHVPEVVNAEIVLGDDGLPNGELREGNAIRHVMRLSATGGREGICMAGDEPENVTAEQRAADKAALLEAMRVCASFGITTAVNMDGNLYQAELLTEMALADELPIRISLPMRIVGGHSDARVAELIEAACRPAIGKLSFGRIKMFMDGVFDTWTAFRTDDYPGQPGFRSHPLFDPERFARICTTADARGLNIQVHCVGDGAVRATLDGYAAARQANGPRDSRHRIEHIDMLHPDDLDRIVDLGVVASMQPVHPPGSSGLPLEPTISIMGRNRWKDTFPWRALTEAGVPLAFGTDWPTAPLSPWNAIHSALTRRPWSNEVPDQRLPFEAVIAAYTRGGAYALFAENRTGRLEAGMAADIALIEGDPRRLFETKDACRVAFAISDGKVVFDDRS